MPQPFRRGAFQGAQKHDACFVKCNAETATSADQDRGIVNMVVSFRPLKAANLQFQQITRRAA